MRNQKHLNKTQFVLTEHLCCAGKVWGFFVGLGSFLITEC